MYSDQNTDVKKMSYCLGLELAANMLRIPFDTDKDAFLEAVTTIVKGNRPDISQDEFQKQIEKLDSIMREKADKKNENIAKNKKAGDDFRAEYEKKEGVIKTKSGLLIKMISEGTGKTPKATDTVKVHYEGHLISGKIFDSSYKRNQPIDFPLNGVIPGWTEGLQHIKEGGKMELVIPPELAYGKHGAGTDILPDSTLIFTVELLQVL